LSVEEIIRGQAQALRRQYVGPAILILLGAAAFLCLRLNYPPTPGRQDAWLSVLMHGAWAAVFIADLFAMARLGMWFGLTSRHTYWAAGKAVLWIQVAPWVAFYVGISVGMGLLMSLVKWGGTATATFPSFFRPEFFVLLWFVISMAFAGFFALWAGRKLRREFRQRVAALPKVRKRGPKPPPLPPLLPAA
jgi:hypothetical protein